MRGARVVLVLLAGAALLSGAASCRKAVQPGDPLAELTDAQRDDFKRGRDQFESVFVQKTGL